MHLPNARRAVVATAKIVCYLLDENHPKGKSKAAFFVRLGFRPTDPQTLQAELLKIAIENEIQSRTETEFGIRYVIDGWIHSPADRRSQVRTVWFVASGEETPRFVTAHPIRRRR